MSPLRTTNQAITEPQNILVIRLSAMGDVALTVPVLRAALAQNKNIQLSILTRRAFIPLFQGMEADFVVPDLYGRHKGAIGLFRLYRELKAKHTWDFVIDLHNVLRSKILSTYFKLSGTACFTLDKGRREKKRLVSKKNKKLKPLRHSCERYADVWRRAGFAIDLSKALIHPGRFTLSDEAMQQIGIKAETWVGIAPFARHAQKMYPIHRMAEVIRRLQTRSYRLFLFGGGERERKMAEKLARQSNKVTNLIGRFSLADELALFAKMNLVLSMDSANMHLAALTGTKVISLWGATHPYAGFSAFGQGDEKQMIQIPSPELSCRPCSVFGNKPCYRGDFACMNGIAPELVVEKIEVSLSSSPKQQPL